ncbi:MAG: hypothetical protein K2N87_15385 [Eubacterium sp.]|nr:hypothetical protein [Eubacterium sp.]
MTSVQTLKELKVLQIYYNGQLQFFDDDELQDFLQITGKYGRSVEDRLGITGSLTVFELANIARRKAVSWNEKANGCMLPGSYIDAASIIARSYEQMYYHLNALSEE